MPALDWSWLEAINLFQVAVVIVSLFIITRLLMRFWPWLRKVMALTAALAQLPDFIERTDLTLRSQDLAIKSIFHETHKNDGSSLKDSQDRTEKEVLALVQTVKGIDEGVAGLHMKVADLTAADAAQVAAAEEIRHELELTKPPARKRATKPKENPNAK